jgi:Mn-dependent DtxR family transcriptional regulator
VDDSEEQTIRILEENFKSTEKKLRELKGEINFNQKYELLRECYKVLKPYIVLIPFENDLMDIFPTSNPRTRRDSKKLMQLIKESALLFQHQRCKAEVNEEPVLVASWVDLAHAILLGGPILEATLTGFDKRLLEALPLIYELIDEEGYVTTRSLHEKLKRSSKYAWQILKFFEDNGYIYHDPATKADQRIKGKAKVYIRTGAREYKSLLLAIRNIEWSDIKKKEEDFIEDQIPNFSHQVGDCIYLPEYDPSVPNQVVYNRTSIFSEEFRIYKTKKKEASNHHQENGENLKKKRGNSLKEKIIKTALNADIDYLNLTLIEKAILTSLASLRKYTIQTLIEELKPNYQEQELKLTLEDMDKRGWIQ